MIINNFIDNPQFFGRRRGRKLSISSQLALKDGKDFLIEEEDISNIFHYQNNIVLEIGFGDGENLINSAKINSNFFFIGADPFLNTTAKCLSKVLQYNLKNIVIWPDDVRKIIKFFPNNSISEIKVLFPDPWPKIKHQKRRLIQNVFIETTYRILKPNGIITIATDHDIKKKWVLEKFQSYKKFEWLAKSSKDWRIRPSDCFKQNMNLNQYCRKEAQVGLFLKKNKYHLNLYFVSKLIDFF